MFDLGIPEERRLIALWSSPDRLSFRSQTISRLPSWRTGNTSPAVVQRPGDCRLHLKIIFNDFNKRFSLNFRLKVSVETLLHFLSLWLWRILNLFFSFFFNREDKLDMIWHMVADGPDFDFRQINPKWRMIGLGKKSIEKTVLLTRGDLLPHFLLTENFRVYLMMVCIKDIIRSNLLT